MTATMRPSHDSTFNVAPFAGGQYQADAQTQRLALTYGVMHRMGGLDVIDTNQPQDVQQRQAQLLEMGRAYENMSLSLFVKTGAGASEPVSM